MPLKNDPEEIRKMMGTLLRYGYNIDEIKNGIKIAQERQKNANE